MISIAMTTFNGQGYIEDQLQSLKNQTRFPDEIVICDDASYDNTIEIIDRFTKKNPQLNIKLIVNKENLGYKHNFYNAIKLTSGDIVFLCDQDDVWEKNKIEIMSSVLENDSKILVLNTAVKLIDAKGNTLRVIPEKNKSNCNIANFFVNDCEIKKINYKTFLKGNISPGCTLCFKSIIKDVFTNTYDFDCAHDVQINSIGALSNSLYFYNIQLTNYRIHSNNTIGFSFKGKKKAFNSASDRYIKRVSGIRSELNIAKKVNSLMNINLFEDILEKRYRAVNDGDIINLINLMNTGNYRCIYSNKQVLGDALCAMYGKISYFLNHINHG